MQTTLHVEARHQYGSTAIYPRCAQAQRLADLIGVKTFTPGKVTQLQAIGFSFVSVPPPIPSSTSHA